METLAKVRRDHIVDKKSIMAIARDRGLSSSHRRPAFCVPVAWHCQAQYRLSIPRPYRTLGGVLTVSGSPVINAAPRNRRFGHSDCLAYGKSAALHRPSAMPRPSSDTISPYRHRGRHVRCGAPNRRINRRWRRLRLSIGVQRWRSIEKRRFVPTWPD